MGARVVLPELDDRIRKVIVVGRLTTYDVSCFWQYFKKLDKDKTGFVHLSELMKTIEAPRTLYSDSLLELLEIDGDDGRITFADFLDIIVTYCLFQPIQILKFCFFVFDQDKDGYFTPNEMRMLMNVLHDVKENEKVRGTVKESWMHLEINYDDRVEFEEFEKFHKKYPQLFEPAFQLHIKMMNAFMGESWWYNKKRKLQNIADVKKAKKEKKKINKEKRRQRVRSNKLRKIMGFWYYYTCPCLRVYYIPKLTPEDEQAEEDLKKKRTEEIAAAQRAADAKVKNKETVEWQKYEKKIKPEKGGNEIYIEKKIHKVKRNREVRVETRKERKKERQNMVDDGFEKVPTLDDS